MALISIVMVVLNLALCLESYKYFSPDIPVAFQYALN